MTLHSPVFTPPNGSTGVTPGSTIILGGFSADGGDLYNPTPWGIPGFGAKVLCNFYDISDGSFVDQELIVDENALTARGISEGFGYSVTPSAADTLVTVTLMCPTTPNTDYRGNADAVADGLAFGRFLLADVYCGDDARSGGGSAEMAFTTGTAATDPYVVDALTASEIAAYEADLPMLVAPNAAERVNAPSEWRESGSWASGADVTDANAVISWATSRAADRWPDIPTRPDDGYAEISLIFDLALATFNVVGIFGHNFLAADVTGVYVEIASDNGFTEDLLEIATWTDGFGARLIEVDMDRYADVRWLRVRIESAGTVAPEIGELFLGIRYTPPHRAEWPADDESLESRYSTTETDGGDQQRLKRWSGRLATALTWRPNTDAYVALFRSWFAATRWGTDPFVWIPHPLTAPREAYFARTAPAQSVVNDEYTANTVTVSLIEQAPFVSKDDPEA